MHIGAQPARKHPFLSFTTLLLLAGGPLHAADGSSYAPASRWGAEVDTALERAADNKGQLLAALHDVRETRRDGLSFLIANMPLPDLRGLSAAFLLENLDLAYEAREHAPWGTAIPDDVFLNDVLPYASVNERRDAWRKELFEKLFPLVKDAKSPGEAAHLLNQKIFSLFGVKYSTERRKPDQSPLESRESGLASCTGLSILLIDACRAAGVPARLAGTPNWVNGRGNHTWVEVWDGGWHFAGAAEPDSRGLDHAWFEHDASQAIADSAEHAIYATSFQKTALPFPLVWAHGVDYVSAVNVTERYAAKKPVSPAPKGLENREETTRLLVQVLDHPGGKRVAARVVVADCADPAHLLEGSSRDESADLNDILAFQLASKHSYEVRVESSGRTLRSECRPQDASEEIVRFFLSGNPGDLSLTASFPRQRVEDACRKFFAAAGEARKDIVLDPDLDDLLRGHESEVRRVLWEVYRSADLNAASREDFRENRVRSGGLESPYTLKRVGKKPAGGWPLFIAMHGGGGAPKEVNDSQWRVMQSYYRDQESVPGYLYLALRAPNDAWNGFYADYVYPLVETLIRQLLVCEEVDPGKVFILGYSHGGYGAFAIGPKMPDRFAAIHSSAAAPTDGESSPKTLRNTVFTFMIGEKDHDYGRLERCQTFDKAIHALRGERTDIYPVQMEFQPGHGHGGLPDRDKIKDMYPAVRNPAPRDLTWEMTDGVIHHFYWLSVAKPAKGQEVDATCRDNEIVLETKNVSAVELHLDGRLVDAGRPVTVRIGASKPEYKVAHKLHPSLKTLCASLLERGDIDLASTVTLTVEIPK